MGGVDEHSFTDLHICGGGVACGAVVGGWTAGTGDYDGRMASWRDGAAYAPTERPDGFATPSTNALPAGEPYKAATPGPMAPPQSFDAAKQPALSQIAVEVKQRRNPRDSFEVASTTLTTAPGQPSGKRDPKEPFATSRSADQLPPPTGDPLPPPPGWEAPPSAPQAPAQQWPAPTVSRQAPYPGQPPRPTAPAAPQPTAPQATTGQPNWPAPQAPHTGQPPAPRPQSPPPGFNYPPPQVPAQRDQDPAQTRLLTWIGAATLGLGFVFGPAAPFALLAAGLLGTRTITRTGQLGTGALLTGTLILAFQLAIGSLGQSSGLASIACLVFAALFVRGAVQKF